MTVCVQSVVTNEQYEAFDPKHERTKYSPGDRDPVLKVSWEDAKEYCAWLSGNSGLAIRLPSESECECACRAGSKDEFCFGDDGKLLAKYAWISGGRAHEVGTRRENAWGLHDLHGNVFEWCEDTYHPNYADAPADGTARTEGGEDWRGYRVCRGGGWTSPAEECRSAWRSRYWHPLIRRWNLGFRPAFLPLNE